MESQFSQVDSQMDSESMSQAPYSFSPYHVSSPFSPYNMPPHGYTAMVTLPGTNHNPFAFSPPMQTQSTLVKPLPSVKVPSPPPPVASTTVDANNDSGAIDVTKKKQAGKSKKRERVQESIISVPKKSKTSKVKATKVDLEEDDSKGK